MSHGSIRSIMTQLYLRVYSEMGLFVMVIHACWSAL